MTGRLVYVAGPSGAGKDSLLGWLKDHLPHDAPVAFARRTITRPAAAGGEQHDSIDRRGFQRLREAGIFGLEWEANGLCYGVRHTELTPPSDGGTVIVNGSRAYLPEAARRFPKMTVVHVTASVETRRRRLTAPRQRRTGDQIQLAGTDPQCLRRSSAHGRHLLQTLPRLLLHRRRRPP